MSHILSNLLVELEKILRSGGEVKWADEVSLSREEGETAIERFALSNELWGGAGSIADHDFISDPDRRRALEKVLMDMGNYQISQGRFNPRTKLWMDVFSSCALENKGGKHR